jgi:aspartate kinase
VPGTNSQPSEVTNLSKFHNTDALDLPVNSGETSYRSGAELSISRKHGRVAEENAYLFSNPQSRDMWGRPMRLMPQIMKFGGTSLASTVHIQNAARLVRDKRALGIPVVVVVSAMAGVTDQLLALTLRLHAKEDTGSERDVVSSAGEQISAGLMSLALINLEVNARSFNAFQWPIITDNGFTDANILDLDVEPLRVSLEQGIVPVVAGFQGVTRNGQLTTLGRGGSDTTAVAIAGALSADVCEIYSDVDGIYDRDPMKHPNAKILSSLSYNQAIFLADQGARVLHKKCVELAKEIEVPIHVRSAFAKGHGSWVQNQQMMPNYVCQGG